MLQCERSFRVETVLVRFRICCLCVFVLFECVFVLFECVVDSVSERACEDT